MGERPILFSAPMVRAILEGRKTQTRRPIKPQPTFDASREKWTVETKRFAAAWSGDRPQAAALLGLRENCPIAQPGDIIYVRECWALVRFWEEGDVDEWNGPLPSSRPSGWVVVYAADEECYWPEHFDDRGFHWRPSIHMPKWAARIWLRVTDVRVERVQDITEEGARAEGFEPVNGHPERGALIGRGPSHREGFAQAWADIYGADSWNANQWVWRIAFERTEAPVREGGR